jgi:hypothetical protein
MSYYMGVFPKINLIFFSAKDDCVEKFRKWNRTLDFANILSTTMTKHPYNKTYNQ